MVHHRPTLLTIVLLAMLPAMLLAMLLAACADATPAATSEDPPAGDHGTHAEAERDHHSHGHDQDDHDMPTEADAYEVTIAATEYADTPAEVRVPAGEPVRFRLRNEGTVVHDLDLAEAGLHLHTDPGDDATAVVTIAEPGRYVAECTEAGHTASGMRLVVQAY